jgi:hypothetical protein
LTLATKPWAILAICCSTRPIMPVGVRPRNGRDTPRTSACAHNRAFVMTARIGSDWRGVKIECMVCVSKGENAKARALRAAAASIVLLLSAGGRRRQRRAARQLALRLRVSIGPLPAGSISIMKRSAHGH